MKWCYAKNYVDHFLDFLSSPFLVDHFCQKFVIAQFISERFNYTNNIPKFPLTSKLPHIQWNNCQFPFFKLIRAYLRNFLSLCFNNIIVFLKFYSSLIKSCSLQSSKGRNFLLDFVQVKNGFQHLLCRSTLVHTSGVVY